MADESAGPGVFMLGESSIKPEWTAEGRALLDIDSALAAALEKIRQERDEALAALTTARAAAVGVLEGCWDQMDGMVIDDPEGQSARARAMRAITEGIKELTEARPSLAVASACGCPAERRWSSWDRTDHREGCPDKPTDAELHDRRAHPDYEYATTGGQRKCWDDADTPPEGEGWVRNTFTAGGEGWERFDYTEESYWMRPKPAAGEVDCG